MLGIIVTSYSALPNCIHHDLMLSALDKDNFKSIFLTTWEDKDFIQELSKNLKTPIAYLHGENGEVLNPGHHDGVYYMCASVVDEFKDCDYILHFHADNFIRDGIETIKKTYEYAKQNNIKVIGLPRQWLFDDDLKVNDKSIPFHFEFCMMEYNVWKNAFDLNRLNEYKQLALNNGHPSQQFEPCLYHGLVSNNININKDIYYLESINELKNRFGNEPVYYNFFFKNSGIFHYDETSLKYKLKK